MFAGPSDTIPVTFLHSCRPWPLVPLVFNQGDAAPGYSMSVGVSGARLVSAPPHPGFHTNLQSEGTSATTAQNLSFLFCSGFAFLCSLLSGSLSTENCGMELEHVILMISKIRHRQPSKSGCYLNSVFLIPDAFLLDKCCPKSFSSPEAKVQQQSARVTGNPLASLFYFFFSFWCC